MRIDSIFLVPDIEVKKDHDLSTTCPKIADLWMDVHGRKRDMCHCDTFSESCINEI